MGLREGLHPHAPHPRGAERSLDLPQGLPQQQNRGNGGPTMCTRTPRPDTRLPPQPTHLLQGVGEVGGLRGLAGVQQQVPLALGEQGDGAQGDVHLLEGCRDLFRVLPGRGGA